MIMETKQLFRWSRTFHKGREFSRCRRLVAGILMVTASASVVAEGPVGEQVLPGGLAFIDRPDADTTNIEQITQRVDINWTSFNTDSNHAVDFNQPNALAVAINRISGAQTEFNGTLTANGRIFLINQNGFIFREGSSANVGSLLVTNSDTDLIDDDLDGIRSAAGIESYKFTGEGYARIVVEQGVNITVSNGGFAVLAAPYVENAGFIKADYVAQVDDGGLIPPAVYGPMDRQGQVELASTNGFTVNVDLRGDSLITFATTPEHLGLDGDGYGGDQPLGVNNKSEGVLQSKSGHVYLTANMKGHAYLPASTAQDIVEGVINLSGVVDADQFVDNGNGGTVFVASVNGYGQRGYPGGTIKVISTGDIDIGGGADIHAVGGEQVTGHFHASENIKMGADGDPARITIKATGEPDGYYASNANAEAQLEIIAKNGSLVITEGEIEVAASAAASESGDRYEGISAAVSSPFGRGNARAVATALMSGEHVDINADVAVTADARASLTGEYIDEFGVATCNYCESDIDGAEAIAALDVFATGNSRGDYPEPGNLDMQGDIEVTARAWTGDSRTSMATANTILASTGNLDVEGDINVDAVAISEASVSFQPVTAASYDCLGSSCNGIVNDAADANAALVMLGGAPVGLLRPIYHLSVNEPGHLGTLSDILTLTNLDDLLDGLDGFDGLGEIGMIGNGNVHYKGDINVTSLAEYNAIGVGRLRTQGDAQATSAAYIVAGGDTYIDTDPIVVDSQAYANYDDYDFNRNSVVRIGVLDTGSSYVNSEARSFLVFVAGLGDLHGGLPVAQSGGDNGYHGSDLTILGDVSATATDQETLNGDPVPYPGNPLTGALTALFATGDIMVRGRDPLAQAGPASDVGHTARVQGRETVWQECDMYGCSPVEDGLDGLRSLASGGSDIYVAQLIIEAGGDIDIQTKSKTQPAGLFQDPVGPDWPGNQPLRFDASGRMQVATGADATRPPRITTLDNNVAAAILAGGDPGKLLPPTASGGCVVAGRDAFTVSEPDYYDRMISKSCESAD